MAKKDFSWNYWGMTYRGKFKRTLVMIPIAIVAGVIAPFYTEAQYGSRMIGYGFDVLLVVVGVAQLAYNWVKMRSEESVDSEE